MTNTHVTGQVHQLLLVPEDFRAKTISLTSVKLSARSAGSDTASILSTMLKNRKGVMDIFHGRAVGIGEYGGDDSAHFGNWRRR